MKFLSALKAVATWCAKNPKVVIEVADKVKKFKSEDKLEQLGEVVEELDKKIEKETIQATCSEEGRIVFACECGAEKYDEIPKTDHTYETVAEEQATTENNGKKVSSLRQRKYQQSQRC